MSNFFAISIDCPASPSIFIRNNNEQLQNEQLQDEANQELYGWGIGWYAIDNCTAILVKDAQTTVGRDVTHLFQDWQKFYSTIFMCYIRGAAKGLNLQDTQPFSRMYAGREWMMSHLGVLNDGYQKKLTIQENPLFEPLGKTDSEYIFCSLLSKIHQFQVRDLNKLNWNNLHDIFLDFNDLGTTSLILTDGRYLVVYQDATNFKPLYWCRRKPPHQQKTFAIDNIMIELENDLCSNKTIMLFSTHRPDEEGWQTMLPGQMIITNRGRVVWNNVKIKENKLPEETNSTANSEIFKYSNKQITTDLSYIPYQHEDYQKKQQLNILHETIYKYSNPVEYSKHFFRLHPIHDGAQQLLNHNLTISVNGTHDLFKDVFGNRVSYFIIEQPYTELIIRMTACVNVFEITKNNFNKLHENKTFPLVWMPWQQQMMSPYLLPFELPESQLYELTEFAMSFVERNNYDLLEVLEDINKTIYEDFKYVSGSSTLQSTPFEVYIDRQGVCQDFANLFICLARLLNIPARYRAGYIYTGTNYANQVQSDASHAWIEVFLPWFGWIGYDPTNGCLASKDHIKISCGRAYYDATPTAGTIFKGGGNEFLETKVEITRAEEGN